MGVIRRLSPSVVNQIAAGEVVERPSSVVKELLENAIDAGATRVDVVVERGGKDLVRVADNGVGMDADDLLLAFQAHATSKLAEAEDLHRVRTLGFRGEALAAIAEVSKVRCQTRPAGADEGAELSIEGGIAGPIRPSGGPPGTVLEVRNLFFNTPVRRAFLKSDLTEAGHVSETFARVALAHPEVRLTFRSGSKVVHDLPSVTGMRERIATFFGRELADSLLWVEGKLDRLHLWGYVAHPSQSRSTTKGQYLFLGGRYVRDRSLGHALNEAYRGLLMVGRHPVAFLNLEVDPEEVDVNVHPTKIEVRFRDPQRVYSHLLSTLRQTFLASDLHSRLQVAPEVGASAARVPGMPNVGARPSASHPDPVGIETRDFALLSSTPTRQSVAEWFGAPESRSPTVVAPDATPLGSASQPPWARALLPLGSPPGATSRGPFDEFAHPQAGEFQAVHDEAEPESAVDPNPGLVHGRGVQAVGAVPASEATATSTSREVASWGTGQARAIQVHDSYLIAETSEGMVVIDQHALHERILYEELRQSVARGRLESQGMLVPEPVHLTADEAAALLEQSELLAELGVQVEGFGGDTVLVRALPAMLSHLPPDRLVRDLAEQLHSQALPPSRDALLSELLHMVACKAAVKAGQHLTREEIDALLDRRHLVADSHHCPHGRPTALIFTKAELEKQFGRV